MDKQKKLFPKDFLWGASTASHQVEGHTHNQWTQWELSVAAKQAKTAKQRLSWIPGWENFKAQAETPQNYISGRGIEHYKLYPHDMAILKKLNLNSYRFGIEWSRVEPEEGVWNKHEWEHYKQYIQTMLDKDIEPILNIWHWTLPIWFTDKGGFAKRANLQYFDRFVQKLCEELQIKDLKYIITLNEPNIYASFGYATGEWPPNLKKPFKFLAVYYNLTLAHKRSYKILKKANSKLQVGTAPQLANMQAKRPHNVLDQIVTWVMRYLGNWWFLNRIKRYQDFIGFNYYFTDYYRVGSFKDVLGLKFFYKVNPSVPLSDLGWYMEPEGIYHLMVRIWSHYKKPIIITENGLADANDQYRRWWLEESMIAIEKALSEGVRVQGYLHWSLLDNFEWAYGWWPKFGLVAVDRANGMKRTVRPSAKWWAMWLANKK